MRWCSIFFGKTKKVSYCECSFKINWVQKHLKDDNPQFDWFLLKTRGFSQYHAFADHFNVPVVGINSADSPSIGHEIMGNVANRTAHPERIVPLMMMKRFKERFSICFFVVLMNLMILSTSWKSTNISRRWRKLF